MTVWQQELKRRFSCVHFSERIFYFYKTLTRDKRKEIEIILAPHILLKFDKEVMRMAENDSELLNNVYREIADSLGMDTAMDVYKLFRGQQITFPVRFLNPARIQRIIIQEYDGTNIKALATKYNYSEKTVRRIIRESVDGT